LFSNHGNFEGKVLKEPFLVAFYCGGPLSNLRFKGILGHNMGDAKMIIGEGRDKRASRKICFALNCVSDNMIHIWLEYIYTLYVGQYCMNFLSFVQIFVGAANT